MWRLELSDEVTRWYAQLSPKDRGQTDRLLDLLAERGPHLRMPQSKYLGGKLYELRFRCEQVNRRITYTIDDRIITLTTFRKQRQNEVHEIGRAREALDRNRTRRQRKPR